jgi:hypothetical protein
MLKRTATLALGSIALLAASPNLAQAQAPPASVVIIHGVPDATVDVYVNGALTLDDFAPNTVTDPVELPAGTYDIEVRGADAAATDPALFGGSATVSGGMDYSVVAHLTAAGTPTLTAFANDAGPTAAGSGCVIVRHTAAAPAVDVYAGDTRVISGLANPESSATLEVPVGTVPATVTAAGASAAVLGPADVPVTEGDCTIVYAVGSLEAQNLGVLVQTLPVGTVPEPTLPEPTVPQPTVPQPTTPPTPPTSPAPIPNRVDSGDSGLAAGSSGTDLTYAATLAGLALLSGGTGAVALARSRRR